LKPSSENGDSILDVGRDPAETTRNTVALKTLAVFADFGSELLRSLQTQILPKEYYKK
jgi:hypothetical protein